MAEEDIAAECDNIAQHLESIGRKKPEMAAELNGLAMRLAIIAVDCGI